MILIKTAEEIELMRNSNQLVSKTLAELAKHIEPGVSTEKLDQIAEAFIRDHGAVPGFLGYQGYPKTLCTSVNSQVVHGIPSHKVILNEGDLISVDCGVIKEGFYGDTAFSFEVGEVSEKVRSLLSTTRESLMRGIEQVHLRRWCLVTVFCEPHLRQRSITQRWRCLHVHLHKPWW